MAEATAKVGAAAAAEAIHMYKPCFLALVTVLERLVDVEVPAEYTYYGIPSPWLQALNSSHIFLGLT